MSEGRQAVIVIHGMGEQRPMSTLREFADGVIPLRPPDPSAPHDPASWSRPDDLSDSVDRRRYVVPSTRTRPVTDLFEFSWAEVHHLHGHPALVDQTARHAVEDLASQGRDVEAYQRAQAELRREQHRVGAPWLVSDVITVGSPTIPVPADRASPSPTTPHRDNAARSSCSTRRPLSRAPGGRTCGSRSAPGCSETLSVARWRPCSALGVADRPGSTRTGTSSNSCIRPWG